MAAVSIVIIVVSAALASFIQRVTGFGFGIVIMTVLPFLMPSYGEATALSGLLALVGTSITLVQLRQHISWRKLLPILFTFIAVSFFSVKLLGTIDEKLIKKVLGAMLICISARFFFVKDNLHLRPTLPLQFGMGTVSGLMGGLFAMQGPPAVIYFLSCTECKEEYTALTAAYFVLGNLAMTAFRAGNGFLTAEVWEALLFGIPAVLLGLTIGSKVYSRIPVGTLRKFVYAFLAVAGLLALLG